MKPILFNTQMVRAILEGYKTCTRRVIKQLRGAGMRIDGLNPKKFRFFVSVSNGNLYWADIERQCIVDGKPIKAPYMPGDILYVRETWCDPSGTGWPILYKADMPMHWNAEDTELGEAVDMRAEDYQWCPSIHMPKDAARLFLRVKSVGVERLQDITEAGKTAEGMRPGWQHYNFYELWDSTIKPKDRPVYGWYANPWVWVIEFDRISKEAAYGKEEDGCYL